MVHLIRRGAPLVAALLVLLVGLVGASCSVSVSGPQQTPPASATPTFAITFNGKIFQCSQGNCPADLAWNGMSTNTGTSIISPSAHAAILPVDARSVDPNYTDKVSFSQAGACFTQQNPATGGTTTLGCFAQNPGSERPITIGTGAIFLVHTSGLPSATTPPAVGTGYYSVVQVYSDSTDATTATTSLVLYFVTFSKDGGQRAAGAAGIRSPLKSAHVTVNMQTGGSASVLDGSTSTSATPTATSSK